MSLETFSGSCKNLLPALCTPVAWLLTLQKLLNVEISQAVLNRFQTLFSCRTENSRASPCEVSMAAQGSTDQCSPLNSPGRGES